MFTWQNAILSHYEVIHYRYRLNILTMIFSGLPLSTCIRYSAEVCSGTVVTRHWFGSCTSCNSIGKKSREIIQTEGRGVRLYYQFLKMRVFQLLMMVIYKVT